MPCLVSSTRPKRGRHYPHRMGSTSHVSPGAPPLPSPPAPVVLLLLRMLARARRRVATCVRASIVRLLREDNGSIDL